MTFGVYLLLLGSAHAVFLPNASSKFTNSYRPRIDVETAFLIGPLGPSRGPSGVAPLEPLSSFVTPGSSARVPKFGSEFPTQATITSTPSTQNVTEGVVPAKSSRPFVSVALPSSIFGSVDGSQERSAFPEETGNTRSKEEIPGSKSIPTSTTTQPLGIILPVTTSVQKPKATDDASIIPCDMWFFKMCLHWEDFNILGWEFNLPPGIHPPGPPPAITFPSSMSVSVNVKGNLPDWPEVTVDHDRQPTFRSESKCETTSAELCLTRTSHGVSSTVKVLSTCVPVYGCHVEGSESSATTTKTCSTCSTCYPWPYDKEIDWEVVKDNDLEPRMPAAARHMMQMASPVWTTHNAVSTMSFNTAASITSPPASPSPVLQRRVLGSETRGSKKFGGCDLGSKITMKEYPSVIEYAQFPEASSYFVVTAKEPVNGACQAAYPYSTNNLHGVSVTAGSPTYAIDLGQRPTPVVNSDHVYELQLLGDFFGYSLGLPGAPTCQQFRDLFVNTGWVQKIFDKLPNEDYPDFAAMDRYINQKKGSYLARTANPPRAAIGDYSTVIQNLQDYGVTAAMIGLPEIVELFRRTHERLYQELQGWDSNLQGCNALGGTPTWAASYSVWMTNHLAARTKVWTDAAIAWYQTLDNAVAAHTPVPAYQYVRQKYPVGSYSIPVADMGENLAAAPGPVKRSAMCTIPTHSSKSEPLSKSEPSSKAEPSPKPEISTKVVLPKVVSTSSVPTTKASAPAPSSSPDVLSIDIYTDNSCLNVLNTTELFNFGDCYSPKDSKDKPIDFACFALTNIPQGVMARGAVTAFKEADCKSKSESDRKEYLVPNDIQYDNERPFKMGSLQLNTRQV